MEYLNGLLANMKV